MLRTFYGDVLPGEGPYCLWTLDNKQHHWVDDLDSLTALTERQGTRQGVYFGTAAFIESGSRKQDNVRALKALRLDIDAGQAKFSKNPTGTYETQRHALAACIEFFKKSMVAPTYVLSSGEGLHIYFCLSEEVDSRTWLSLSRGLQEKGAAFGLRIDPSVTCDSARILRPVGTVHPNGKAVEVLHRVDKFYTTGELQKLLQVAPVQERRFDTSINNEALIEIRSAPSSALKIAEKCGAVREVAACGGDVQEPYWRSMIGLVKRTIEGIDIAQEWSSGHPGYDPDEVQRKFDAWSAGPTTCEEFAKHTDACGSCAFRGKFKSPIALGVMSGQDIEELPEEKKQVVVEAMTPKGESVEGTPWQGCIPEGYVIKDGSLVKAVQVETPNGATTLVIPFASRIIWVADWSAADNTDDDAKVTLKVYLEGRVVSYSMNQYLVANRTKLLEFLAGKAVQTGTHELAPKLMHNYIKDSLSRVRDLESRPKVTDHFGLRILDDGQLVAVQGQHVIYGDGKVRTAVLGGALRSICSAFPVPVPPSLSGTWDSKVWDTVLIPKARQHVEFLRKHYGAKEMARFQLAIMLGLASGLMPFVTGEFVSGSVLPRMSSISVSLYSRQSARGKTTAAMAAILAYGKPAELTNDSGARGATDNGRMARLSLHGSLPNIMDEMGSASPASVANMISAVANGAGRQRATKDGGMNASAPWALVNIITTNTSQRDMINAVQDSSAAIQYRLLEINVEDVPTFDHAQRDTFAAEWAYLNQHCVGALGAVIHLAIAKLGVVKVSRLAAQHSAEISKQNDSNQTDRFQYRAMGAALTAHSLLKLINLAPFDEQVLRDVFATVYNEGKEFIEASTLPSDGVELMARALRDLLPNTLVTASEIMGGHTMSDTVLNERLPTEILARHVKDANVTYLMVDALRKWCVKNGVSEREILKACKKSDVIEYVNYGSERANRSSTMYTLSKGVRQLPLTRARCYKVSLNKLYGVDAGVITEMRANAA